ncbi:MAG: DUF1499 domain-containing protein [Brevundimonas sp.]|nr:MAG: DUF1499 domain-containing protein [Brevundimonas sp.]
MARTAVKGKGAVLGLAVVALAAPILALLCVVGVRSGLLSLEIGYDLLMLRVGWWLAWVGAAAAVLAVILALRNLRELGPLALAAVIAGGATLGVNLWQRQELAAGPVENVSTDLAEVPGFGRLRPDDMGQGATVGAEACPGALPVMSQVAPASAAWAIQEAGFNIGQTGVARADGSRRSIWFGFRYDVVIRIRPGRTDIRVAAREGRPHGGEACRLVTRISSLLQPAA